MDRPAAEDRMAVLEMSEFPGKASMMDCALVLGSSGTLDAGRVVVREVRAGSVRGGTEGRRRAAPVIV